MRRSVAGIRADCHLQRCASLVKLALPSLQHSEVVIGLRQLGEIFDQFGENNDGILRLVLLRQNHAFEKAHLRIFGFASQKLIGFACGFRKLTGAHQPVDLGVISESGLCKKQAGHQAGSCKQFERKSLGQQHEHLSWTATNSRIYTAVYCNGSAVQYA